MVKIGGSKTETSHHSSWATRNDGAMLACHPAKKKEQSSLLYNSKGRAKLSHFPFALGTSPAHHKSLLQELIKPAQPWQFCCRREEKDSSGYAVFINFSALRNAKGWTGVTSSPLSLWFECVSGMGLAQMPCSSWIFATCGESKSPPLCLVLSPLGLAQDMCFSHKDSLRTRKSSIYVQCLISQLR